jgi:hypothetical protein
MGEVEEMKLVCKWMQQMFFEGATLAIRLSSPRKPFLGSKGAP